MRLLSPRLVIPAALIVVAWGGIHLLESGPAAVTPAVWPIAPVASPSGPAAAVGALPTAAATSSPLPGGGGIPVLPAMLQQLNGSTRDTAVGLYALIRQLEEALRTHLEQLQAQLEPGR